MHEIQSHIETHADGDDDVAIAIAVATFATNFIF